MLRHELSVIFGDMPNTEYATLLKSVQDNGFTHPKIITYEDKILDGWHRCRVAEHLGKISDLVFEELSGMDPAEFVKAENYHRRHLSVGHRAVIEVKLNDWLEKGDVASQRDDASNDAPITRDEMAKSAEVSPKSIERAKVVVKAGREDEVISGAKSVSQIVNEERDKAVSVDREEVSDEELAYDHWLDGLSTSEIEEIGGDDRDNADDFVFELEFERQTGLKLNYGKSDSDVMQKEVEPVPESVYVDPVPEPTEDDFLRVVLDSDMVIHDNALAMSRGALRKMPDMSAKGWKALRRNVLRVVHPDKIDMSDWTDAEKASWTVLFEFMNDFLGELERDYREYAEIKSRGGS